MCACVLRTARQRKLFEGSQSRRVCDVRLGVLLAALKEEGITGVHSGSTHDFIFFLLHTLCCLCNSSSKTSALLANNLPPTVISLPVHVFHVFFFLLYVQLTFFFPVLQSWNSFFPPLLTAGTKLRTCCDIFSSGKPKSLTDGI